MNDTYTSGTINDPGFYREACLPVLTNTTGGSIQTGDNVGGYWPYTSWPYTSYPSVWVTPYSYPVTPVECSGDVHVFPCPHCDKCKCGHATVKREKKRK